MQFSTLFITAVLSAGALSMPTEPFDSNAPTPDLDARSWIATHPYIGNYAAEKCKGNGIKNGHRPKINAGECKVFIHNKYMNGTFPYLKIDFGNLFNTVQTVRLYRDTHCKEQIGEDRHIPDDTSKETDCFHADQNHYTDIGSVKAFAGNAY